MHICMLFRGARRGIDILGRRAGVQHRGPAGRQDEEAKSRGRAGGRAEAGLGLLSETRLCGIH